MLDVYVQNYGNHPDDFEELLLVYGKSTARL